MKFPTTPLVFLLTTLTSTLALPAENSAQVASQQIVDKTLCGMPPVYAEYVNCQGQNTCPGRCATNNPSCVKRIPDLSNGGPLHILIYCS
ncbi:hypothetical protein Vi05172_g11673 [Venturia inaequalis]|nr:hypothetical protein Vi05172_g11673 [Venturia inaequalis]